jgi:hypothetical protein
MAKQAKQVKVYLDKLSEKQIRKIAKVAVLRLIETEDVCYREADESEGIEECVYWESCGDSLLDD